MIKCHFWNIKLCKGRKQKMKVFIPANSNSCQASTSRDPFSFQSHRKKLEPIMCFPYPHAAQTINGWDTLTATFQGRRTHRQTDRETDRETGEAGAPPGRNEKPSQTPGRLSSAARRRRGQWFTSVACLQTAGGRSEITKRQTGAVTSSRTLFPAPSVSPAINNRWNGVYFKQRLVNMSGFFFWSVQPIT